MPLETPPNRAPEAAENNNNQLSLLTVSETLNRANSSEPTAAGDFGRSFVYSLAQAPAEGLAQIIDGKADGNARQAVHFMNAPETAEFGTGRWAAQQAGMALGSLLPLLAVHKGVSATMGRSLSARSTLAMTEHMEALTLRQKFQAGGLKAVESGLTGVIFSGVLTPVQASEEDFWQARARNATVGGLTFSTLAASGLGLKSFGEASRASMPALSSVLRSEAGAGVISGLPAGLVAANSESLLSGHGMASAKQQLEAAATFSIMGGGFALGKAKLVDLAGPETSARPQGVPEAFRKAGVDVDGRALEASNRANVAKNLPDYATRDMIQARKQTLEDIAEINASKPGTSVLDQLVDSGLSITQKHRVLSSLAEVREHFVNQRAGKVGDPDQQGNWIHTQGEFGRVIDASKAGKLSPAQTEDALLASMFADSVKTKANFFHHHMDGALAADHVLSKQLGGDFTRQRLDGIINSIREHQIGPPEFMANKLYGPRIMAALKVKGNISAEQQEALTSLQAKMADPLNPAYEKVRTADGATALKLTPQEKALLNEIGVPEWYVPEASNRWNAASRAVIDGDTLDNYFTPGGIGKIASLGGPESDIWFKTRQIDNKTMTPDRDTNVGSARASGVDAGKLLTPESRVLGDAALASTERAIGQAKERVGQWLASEKGVDPKKQEVPFFNGDLKYPSLGEAEGQWWTIHRIAADKRSPEQQAFYNQHRFSGFSQAETDAFLRAKDIRDRLAAELRRAQRVNSDLPPDYKPTIRK